MNDVHKCIYSGVLTYHDRPMTAAAAANAGTILAVAWRMTLWQLQIEFATATVLDM